MCVTRDDFFWPARHRLTRSRVVFFPLSLVRYSRTDSRRRSAFDTAAHSGEQATGS